MLVRFTVTLSTSEHLLYWQRHKPAPLEIASIAITRQSLPRSRLEYCSAAKLLSRCHKEDYGLAVLKNAKSHQPASRYTARSARCKVGAIRRMQHLICLVGSMGRTLSCKSNSGKSSSILPIAPTLLQSTSICSALLNIIF
jgi:molybdenum cofactor biosynthesis enzyme MoaA